MADICEYCGHTPHANRCFFTEKIGQRYIQCTCKHKTK